MALTAMLAAFPPLAAIAAPTSVYTKLDFDNNCMALSTYDEGGVYSCNGWKGFAVTVSVGDLRESVFFGHLGPMFTGADGSQAFATFGPFNRAGDTIEWRLDATGVPFATILRWRVERFDGDLSKPKDEVLVVSRVGRPGETMACPAGLVHAGATKDANAVARDVADRIASTFACGRDEPEWHGTKPADAPEMTVYWPGRDG
jgi:hypothetical protein